MVERASDVTVRDATLLEAVDLQTARDLLGSCHVDLLLLDVRLPDGSGLDLAGELRARQPSDRPVVIVMSASVLPTERDAAIAAGADRFLAKPYRAADLLALMSESLSGASGA